MGCSSSAAEGKGRARAQVHPQPGLLYAWVDFGELLMKVLSPHTDGFVSETLFQMSPNTDGDNVFIIITIITGLQSLAPQQFKPC